ncbi:unnamed protein product [Prorocentrum cordatum]|uniref:Uncharacterized protein n=1 Tax=Prorocentrum cordatum TaxID=2364126 RepID=A0ABN9VKB4_9DINO|nr:unnamed protein product [Polarella glacialis]|mmetsp:Transcript_25826/g.68347  ORF Transcript_25826/g.68347 Transcript_25826/m.68347 type:complete len:299 (+) Transcript_25826:66-962(+)
MVLTSLLSVEANLAIVYVGLSVGTCLLCCGMTSKSGSGSMRAGMVLLTALGAVVNYRYGIRDVEETIAFFNSMYDPFYLAFAGYDLDSYPGLARCHVNNTCSLLSYGYHASWAVAFHRRFTEGAMAGFNCARLYSHVWMNTTAFIICLVQFHEPTRRKYLWIHKKLGWAAISLVTVGTASALWLGSEHGSEEMYGANYAVAGWFSMAATMFGMLIPGVWTILRKDVASHRKWMTRFYGAMWGAFLVFRIIFLFGGFFRWHRILIIQLAVWTSAPLGVLCAEFWRVRSLGASKNSDKSV